MATEATPNPARPGKILIHRVWHVGTGKMRPDKAREYVDEFRERVNDAKAGEELSKSMGEEVVFYDIFIPGFGADGSDVTVTVVRPTDDVVNVPRHGNLVYKYHL